MSDPAPTLTLAGLYQRQGLVGRAREIYRRLSEEGPPAQREEAARRLRELGPSAAGTIALLQALVNRVQERRRR